MAISISPIIKPTIWLIGNLTDRGILQTDRFSGFVDHYKNIGTDSVSSTTPLDEDNLMTFEEFVRIIITTNVSYPKPTYVREGRPLTSLEFEGKNKDENNFNLTAETYYTLNGKDPIRTSSYLYKYSDLNDRERDTNPSNLDPKDNIGTLGFLLKVSPTGSNTVILKSRTYYDGKISPVSVAKFRIYFVDNTLSINNENSNK